MFQKISEVYEHLDEKGLQRVSSFLKGAVAQEVKYLSTISEDSEETNQNDAEEQFVDEINAFLKDGVEISPSIIINYRRRPKAWAVAECIKKTGESDEDTK